MPWSEKWRSQERPNPDEIPDEYSLSSTVAENKMIGYFTGVLALAYVVLKLWGSQPSLIAGIPLLMWITVGISVLVLIGLYASVSQRSASRSDAPVPTNHGMNDD